MSAINKIYSFYIYIDLQTHSYQHSQNRDWIRIVSAHLLMYLWVAKEVKFHISLITPARKREI